MCPPHYWVVPDYNSYPLKIRVLVCPMRLAPSLLMHARARSHRATHNQVPREAEAAWPVDPFLGGIGRAPNKSSQRGGRPILVFFPRCRCRAVIYFETSPYSLHQDEGKEAPRGLDRAHSPLRLPPSTGHSENLPRPAACESGPHNAGPATRSSFFGGGSGGSTAVSDRLTVLNCLQLCKPSTFGPQKRDL